MADEDAHSTLQTIARGLGLHISTVSRVLNGTDQQAKAAASSATRALIRQAARELNYRPNPWAASLRTRRSKLIGVLVPRLQDYVLATIYQGIQDTAEELGYHTMVSNTYDDAATLARQFAYLEARKVDGVIFGDARSDSDFLDQLDPAKTKFVLVNRHHNDLVAITCDDYLGGRLAAEHLLAIGRTEAAVLAGSPYATTAQDRCRGFLDVFRQAGVELRQERILFMGFDAIAGRAATEHLLQSSPKPPDSIFFANDFGAIATLGVLRDHGLAVPADVAVVGYNDVELAAEVNPSLTTIRSPMWAMGSAGMRALATIIDDGSVESRRLTPDLVVRHSTVA